METPSPITFAGGDALSLRVLLVEDTDTAAIIAEAAIEKAGRGTAEALRATTLAQALDIVRSADVHLVLLDLNLPDSNDLETLDRIRVATRCPIIVITSDDRPGLDEEALYRGAFEILHKGMIGPDSIARMLRLAVGQRRLQASLEDMEHRYHQLIEVSLDAIFVHSDWRIVLVNPAMLALFGAERSEQLLGRDVLELVAPGSRDAVDAGIRRLYEEREPVPLTEIEYLRADGTRFDAEVTSAPFRYEGRPAAQVMARDITARKHAEEQIRNYVTQLEAGVMRTVGVATAISGMRDPYTAGHERRVAEIAAAIGAELGFDARRIEGLRVAGHLHDIGKIIIPSEILSKPGKLSEIEYQLIRGHAQASFEVMKDVDFPWPVAQVALQHHERVDGSGYPNGLKRDAIVIEARIISVADVIEAMSSHRPYRAGLGVDMALAEIERGRGTAYDPDVVDVCVRMFREKNYQLPQDA